MPSRERIEKLIRAIKELDVGDVRLMEVCGTHTMAIAKSGIKNMLPENVKLLSGPGCPVCVTPPQVIDAILELGMDKDIIIASYGDMLRVPGSRRGDSLLRRRALGARLETVYSPVDAIKLAEENPEKQVVFLGVGFETTAPGTAAAIMTAREQGVDNFSVLSMLKTVEPALRALTGLEGFNVDGFICPGHVAVILGERGFDYIARDFSLPGAIAGFEPEDILLAVYKILLRIKEKRPGIDNCYARAVSPEGNELARAMMDACLEERADIWRGLGTIEESGLGIREEFSDFDAQKRFNIKFCNVETPTACRCGDVICGRISPGDCPMFGSVCTPEDPLGPCMVSSEGACAAAYKYAGLWL